MTLFNSYQMKNVHVNFILDIFSDLLWPQKQSMLSRRLFWKIKTIIKQNNSKSVKGNKYHQPTEFVMKKNIEHVWQLAPVSLIKWADTMCVLVS